MKIVDPMGEMLEPAWELHATEIANARNADELFEILDRIATERKINLTVPANVVFARDTRYKVVLIK